MRRGTTPTLTFIVKGLEMETMDTMVITLKQENYIVNKTPTYDNEDNTLKVTLTQEETLGFKPGKNVSVQIKAKSSAGKVVASNVKQMEVSNILNEEEI